MQQLCNKTTTSIHKHQQEYCNVSIRKQPHVNSIEITVCRTHDLICTCCICIVCLLYLCHTHQSPLIYHKSIISHKSVQSCIMPSICQVFCPLIYSMTTLTHSVTTEQNQKKSSSDPLSLCLNKIAHTLSIRTQCTSHGITSDSNKSAQLQ